MLLISHLSQRYGMTVVTDDSGYWKVLEMRLQELEGSKEEELQLSKQLD